MIKYKSRKVDIYIMKLPLLQTMTGAFQGSFCIKPSGDDSTRPTPIPMASLDSQHIGDTVGHRRSAHPINQAGLGMQVLKQDKKMIMLPQICSSRPRVRTSTDPNSR